MKLVLSALALLGCLQAQAAPFQKVLIVILENESEEAAIRQPYMKKLAAEGATLDLRAETHPSYPNYVALTSGSTWGIHNDWQKTIDATHLGDLLEAKGRSWKVYAEGYPGNCFLGSARGKYARRHVPFLSYKNVQEKPDRCARIVNAAQLDEDVRNGALPDYALYIPDNNDNGHDTGVKFADRWLAKRFTPLLADHRFTDGLLFVVTFDEDDGGHDNQIYSLFWGAGVRAGARSTARYTHYDLLRTVEDVFELGTLGRNDSKARAVSDVWTK
ncbi:MAG: hypothetical protein HY075_04970 [Deltaproteobacteria bacterium]|nr:hypothetical protein [Deltaproteobacteria bacterium]